MTAIAITDTVVSSDKKRRFILAAVLSKACTPVFVSVTNPVELSPCHGVGGGGKDMVNGSPDPNTPTVSSPKLPLSLASDIVFEPATNWTPSIQRNQRTARYYTRGPLRLG